MFLKRNAKRVHWNDAPVSGLLSEPIERLIDKAREEDVRVESHLHFHHRSKSEIATSPNTQRSAVVSSTGKTSMSPTATST